MWVLENIFQRPCTDHYTFLWSFDYIKIVFKLQVRKTLEYSLGLGFPGNLHALSIYPWHTKKIFFEGIETGNMFIRAYVACITRSSFRSFEKKAQDFKKI